MKQTLILIVAGCLGCGDGRATHSTPTAQTAPHVAPSETPTSAERPRGDFDVHEWGLIEVGDSGQTASLLAGQTPVPRPEAQMHMRKPVIYVHLPTYASPLALSIGVSVGTGTVVEQFPEGTLAAGDHGVDWNSLTARLGACHNAVRIAPSDPSCARTGDGICERTELATYETTDSACLIANGVEHNHLFYRARGTPVNLPIRVRRGVNGLVAANESQRAMPGDLFRIRTATNGAGVVVERLSTPSPGRTISLLPVVATAVDGPALLRAAVIQQGLTPPEADAFMRAWTAELFGAEAIRGLRERRRGPAPNVSRDELLYFMPDYLVDAMAPLIIVPAPNTIKRVLLVRQRVQG